MASIRFAKFLKSTLYNFYIFILTLLFVFTTIPTLIIFLTPLYIYRWIIFKSSKYLRPDLGKMLSSGSVVFAAEDIYNQQSTTLVASFQILGTPDINHIRREMEKNALNAKLPKTGELLYPELQQNITSWMGYLFWKPVKHFKLENHIYVKKYEDFNIDSKSPFNYDRLVDITKILTGIPWSKENALWEIIIIPNYTPKNCKSSEGGDTGRSAFFLRIHHGVADGFSIIKMLTNAIGMAPDATMEKLAKPKRVKQNFIIQFIMDLTFFLRAPYEFVHILVTSKDKNKWKLSEEALRSGIVNGAATDKLPLAYLKEIKTRNKVSLTALILAMITGGVREMMMKLKGEVPHKVHVLLPLPWDGHPDKLRNFMTAGLIPLPVGESDPVKRLKKLHRTFESTRKSTIPTIFFYFQKAVGALPICLAKRLKKIKNVTVILSNTPGTPEPLYAFGNLVEEAYVGGNVPSGTTAIICSFNTYNENARLCVGAFNTILPTNTDAEEFIEYCEKQLEFLARTEVV